MEFELANLRDVGFGLLGRCDQGHEVGKVGPEGVDLVDLEEEERLGLLGEAKPKEMLGIWWWGKNEGTYRISPCTLDRFNGATDMVGRV